MGQEPMYRFPYVAGPNLTLYYQGPRAHASRSAISYVFCRVCHVEVFKPKPGCEASLEADDWELDLEHSEFHGTPPGWT